MKGIKRFQLPFSWLVNSLLALETLLPMSARERKLDFLVWWRCFRNNVYMTFSFSSAFSWPLSIWLSMIVSVDREQLVTSYPKNSASARWHFGPLTDNLWQRGGLQVQHDGALLNTHFEFHQAVQGQRGHMRLAPSLTTLLHLLFKLDPSGQKIQQRDVFNQSLWESSWCESAFHYLQVRPKDEGSTSRYNPKMIFLWIFFWYFIKPSVWK